MFSVLFCSNNSCFFSSEYFTNNSIIKEQKLRLSRSMRSIRSLPSIQMFLQTRLIETISFSLLSSQLHPSLTQLRRGSCSLPQSFVQIPRVFLRLSRMRLRTLQLLLQLFALCDPIRQPTSRPLRGLLLDLLDFQTQIAHFFHHLIQFYAHFASSHRRMVRFLSQNPLIAKHRRLVLN